MLILLRLQNQQVKVKQMITMLFLFVSQEFLSQRQEAVITNLTDLIFSGKEQETHNSIEFQKEEG
jgi:hypothetical protein